MTLRRILSLAFDLTDGGLLAPDPSDGAMARRIIPAALCFVKILEMDLDDDKSGNLKLVQEFDEAATTSTGTALPHLNATNLEGTKSEFQAATARSDTTQPQIESADTTSKGPKREFPKRRANSVRVYIEHGVIEGLKDGKDLPPEHLSKIYHEHLKKDVFGDQTDRSRPIMGGYEGLSNQWQRTPSSWLEIPSFTFSESVEKKAGWRQFGYRIWRFKRFIASFRKIAKEICILEHKDGSLTLLISIRTYNTFRTVPNHNQWLLDTVKAFIEKLKGLEEDYHSLLKKSKGTPKRKMIMMLWFANAQLVHVLDVLQKARRSYHKLRRDTLEARNARLLPGVVDDIITDAYLHRELQNRATDFAYVLESLLETASDMVRDNEFGAVVAHVRGLTSDLRRLADDVPRSLEHHLKLLEVRRNVQDSSNQWILTALASIFLPLSLACSLLSMQTRFKDLGYVLYDFCGVVVILLTLVVLMLLVLKMTTWVTEKVEDESRKVMSKPGRMMLKRIPMFLMMLMFIYFMPVFLASFIVGMVKDVRLGGLILGYGLAGLVGVGVVFLVLTALVALFKS